MMEDLWWEGHRELAQYRPGNLAGFLSWISFLRLIRGRVEARLGRIDAQD